MHLSTISRAKQTKRQIINPFEVTIQNKQAAKTTFKTQKISPERVRRPKITGYFSSKSDRLSDRQSSTNPKQSLKPNSSVKLLPSTSGLSQTGCTSLNKIISCNIIRQMSTQKFVIKQMQNDII
ncbi:MAG: hypothetical protein ACK521_10640, partial [bacterium]